MRAVIQRVARAALYVSGAAVAEIGGGLVVYVGIEQSDGESDIAAFCKKLVAMRIFSDADGKLNLSVNDVGGCILLVSNFTLCADISHGNRPSFSSAKRPASAASELFDHCVCSVRELMRPYGGADRVFSGVFGADMLIDQANDGPVTVIY